MSKKLLGLLLVLTMLFAMSSGILAADTVNVDIGAMESLSTSKNVYYAKIEGLSDVSIVLPEGDNNAYTAMSGVGVFPDCEESGDSNVLEFSAEALAAAYVPKDKQSEVQAPLSEKFNETSDFVYFYIKGKDASNKSVKYYLLLEIVSDKQEEADCSQGHSYKGNQCVRCDATFPLSIEVDGREIAITEKGTNGSCSGRTVSELVVYIPPSGGTMTFSADSNLYLYAEDRTSTGISNNSTLNLTTTNYSYICCTYYGSNMTKYHIYIEKVDPATCTHEWEDATCVAPKTCSVCGLTEGEKDPTAHKNNETTHKCDTCGADNASAHSFTEGKCTCGAVSFYESNENEIGSLYLFAEDADKFLKAVKDNYGITVYLDGRKVANGDTITAGGALNANSTASFTNLGEVTLKDGSALQSIFAGEQQLDVTYKIVTFALDKTSERIKELGATGQITATNTPEDYSKDPVVWTSSNEDVATVDQNGTVTTKSWGTTTITAAWGGFTLTCDVTVSLDVEKLTVNGQETTHTIMLAVGESYQINPEVTPAVGVVDPVTYEKKNVNRGQAAGLNCIELTADGKITALSAGADGYNNSMKSCYVEVKVGGKSIKVGVVTINAPANPYKNVTLKSGETTKLSVGADIVAANAVIGWEWTSSDENIAKVVAPAIDMNNPASSNAGEVTAVSCGKATITATAKTASDYSSHHNNVVDGKTVTFEVTVDHTWTDATCTAPKTCSNCGVTEGEPLPHKYETTTVVADCLNAGYTMYDCADCDDVYYEDVVPAKGHSLKATVTDPTHKTMGYTTHKCENCNFEYVDTWTDALAHEYESEVTTPATCTKEGLMTFTCKDANCKESYTQAIPMIAHDYESVVTAPTCEAMGYTTYDCKNCDHSYINDLKDALGHDYESVVTAPTCETMGYTTYDCKNCDHNYIADQKAALGHDCESVVTAPTCTEKGYTTYDCKNCDHSYINDLKDALGHKEKVVNAKEATHDDAGYTGDTVCAVCEKVLEKGKEIAALGCPAAEFSDVDTKAWYHGAVDYVLMNKLMTGIGNGLFAPNDNTTRAMLATLLYRMAGEPSVEGLENPFADVADGQWYTDAVIWAADKGVVSGTSATTFAPNDQITREQMVTMIWRYAGEPESNLSVLDKYADADNVSDFAKEAMAWAISNGIVTGVGDNTLAPKNTATRAQIAAILQRFVEK